MLARWPKKNRPDVRSTAESAFCASIVPSISRTAPWQTSQWPHGAESSPNVASSICRRQRAVSHSATRSSSLAGLDPLALVGRAALGDLAAAQLDVAGAVKRERFGRQAVAAGAADLLIIGFDRGRHVGVKHEAHVGLVDAHAEGDRRADDDAVLLQEDVLVVRAHDVVEAGVIGQRPAPALGELARQLFGAPARGAIDDAALAGMRVEPFDQAGASRWPWAASRERGWAGRTSARTRAASRRNSRSTMSARVGASAVAVTAMVCGSPERLRRPRAGADIRGGSRGPIARRNGLRRWRGDRPRRCSISSVSSRSSRSGAT